MKTTNKILRQVITLLIVAVPVIGKAQLKADFTADVTSGCTPLVVNFTDASTGSPTTWHWDFGNGSYSSEKNPGVILIAPGIYSIKLVVTGAGGTDSIIKTNYINVYALPTVDFSATPLQGCAPLNVTFTNKSIANSGTINAVVWDFGDGTISKQMNPSHTFKGDTSFDIILSVFNNYGCKQSITKPAFIKIPSLVSADFAYAYSNVCQVPAQVDFTNQTVSNDNPTYTWLFADGTQSTDINPSHTYTTEGSYAIKLIAKSTAGCIDTISKTISIGSVSPSFTVADSICTGQTLLFKNNSVPMPQNVLWSFGDGTSDISLNPVHSFSAPGTYTVTMNGNFGTCSGVFSKTIIISNKPKASFSSSGNVATCLLPLPVSFSNSSTGAVSYKWNFGDSTFSTDVNPVHNYLQAGNFFPSLVAFNVSGCSDTLKSQTVIKAGPPVITKLNGLPAKGCAPLSVPFSAVISSPVAITGYLWSFGDGTTSNLQAPVHVYTAVGTYDVSLTVTTAEGCSTTFSFLNAVETGNKPKLSFSANPRAGCASKAVSFTDNLSIDTNSWLWLFGDGGTSKDQNPTYQYQDTGYFNVTLIGSNNTCADTLVLNNYVQIYPPIAQFDKILICSSPFTRTFNDKSIGAQTWNWDFGDGSISTAQSPAHTYATAGSYKVVLKVTNGGCESIRQDSVYVVNGHPNFTSSQTRAICKNDVVTFKITNYAPKDYQAFTWNYGNGISVNKKPDTSYTVYKYIQNGSYQPFLLTKDINGCIDTLSQNVSLVVYGPTANFGNLSGVCLNTPVVFNDSSLTDGVHQIVKWQWNYGDGITEIKTAAPFQHTYAASRSYNVILKVTDNYGCSDSLKKLNDVYISKPTAMFSAQDSFLCLKQNILFLNKSTGFFLKSRWEFGDGTVSTVNYPVKMYNAGGVYSVKLVIADIYGCQDSILKPNYVTVSNPHASFATMDTVGECPPLLTEPVNTSTNYRSLVWQFGDGITSTAVNPQHFYNIPGTYTLKLIVKGYGNCYDTASAKVLLKGPWGTLNYSTLQGCVPTSIAFTSTAKNAAEFVWDFNNGVIKHSLDSTAQYTYSQPGSYLPKLVLIDSAGCKVSVENKNRINISGLTAAFDTVQTNQLYCDSTEIFFRNNSVASYDSIISYKWNFGDNQVSFVSDPSHYYSVGGNYNVSLSVVSKYGCTDTISYPLPVSINKSPSFNAWVKDSVCVLTPVTFTAVNSGAEMPVLWNWDFGDNSTASVPNTQHVYTGGGNYVADIIAVSSAGCSTAKSYPVYIEGLPNVHAGSDTTICLGNSLSLNPTGAVTYKWNANSTLSCLDCNTPVAKPSLPARYYVTGYSNAGCKAMDSIFVNVAQPFTITVSNDAVMCLGQTTTFSATGADKFDWQPKQYLDNANSSKTKFTATTPGDYNYIVTGSDIYNCFTDTASVKVKVYPMPTVSVANNNITASAGIAVQLETQNSPDVTKWKWSPANGLDNPYIADPMLTPKTSGTYTITVANDGNCTATEFVTVNVLCDGRNVFMPNTFSPNNDGMNDRFFPRGKGVFNIKSLSIFNRWGQVVFQKVNFNANDPGEGWDGTFKGVPQGIDVYVYSMEVLCENGAVNKITGNVTLLR